jgi:FkbM family methyltransferase
MLTLAQRAGWLRHLSIACTQQHHLEDAPVFAPHIPRDGVVIDVGAHAGQFSKLFARLAPQGRVYAFEPSAYARSILKPALAWNRLRNVEVIATGLSDADGEATLSTPVKSRGGMGFGLASLALDPARVHADQTVRLQTLDGFAARAGLTRLDFLKADVEGWEAHVIRGGLETVARFRPALFLEIVDEALGRAGETPQAIWEMLTPLGYRALKPPDYRPVAAYDGPSDYLFVAEPKA